MLALTISHTLDFSCVLHRLMTLNLNDCKLESVEFPDVADTEKTSLFPRLKFLTLANNPLNMVSWPIHRAEL